MFRRLPMYVASDLDEVLGLTDAAPAPLVVIFDADNTLVAQGVGRGEFQTGVTEAIAQVEGEPSIKRVIVLSNGPDRGVPGMLHRGNKPWTTRKRLGLQSRRTDVWVIGDQVLTDGVLAWRLGAAYIQLVVDEQTEAARQVFMRRIGRAVSRLLFVPQAPTSKPER